MFCEAGVEVHICNFIRFMAMQVIYVCMLYSHACQRWQPYFRNYAI